MAKKAISESKGASKSLGGKLLKALGWVVVHFGLWIPLLYALCGVVLFFVYGFNPFDGSNNAVLYLIGFGLSCGAAVLVTIRKIIIKPIKKLINKHKKDDEKPKKPARKKQDSSEDSKKPTKRSYFWKDGVEDSETSDNEPQNKDSSKAKAHEPAKAEPAKDGGSELTELEKELKPAKENETPKIYYSTIEPDTLVHEYSDRFEVFKVIGDRKYLSKIEYKDNGNN